MPTASMRQNQKQKFLIRLGRIRERCPDALKWIEDIGKVDTDHSRANPPRFDLWSLAFDQGDRRFGMMTSNRPESLNNVFKEACQLPVTSIVEIAFYKSVKYWAERRIKAEKAVHDRLLFARKVQDLLEKRRLRGNTHIVEMYHNEQKYEVTTGQRYVGNKIKGGKQHTVRIDRNPGTCTCQKPQLTGIPCSHMLACCARATLNSNIFVAPYYRTSNLMATWAPEFEPFENSDNWPQYPKPTLIPDPRKYEVKRGRRQHVRIRTDMDEMNTQRHTYTCSRCKRQGHSKRKCTAPPNDQGN